MLTKSEKKKGSHESVTVTVYRGPSPRAGSRSGSAAPGQAQVPT